MTHDPAEACEEMEHRQNYGGRENREEVSYIQ
jgi:hypothetical protein